MAERELEIIGDEGSHDAIRQVMEQREPCKVLDVPCGHGVLTKFLHGLGWDVHAADIDQGNFQYEAIPFTQVNLNRTLPFEDESFDAVMCVNGLHRLFNPGGAIGEFSRILRPDGTLYINVNNYSSLDRRIRFLFMGSINDMVNKGICPQTIDDPEAHIRVALVYPQLAGILEARGFEVIDIRPAALRKRARILKPVAWIVRSIARFIPKHRQEGNHVLETNCSALLPGGAYFFVEAVKKNRAG